MYLNSPASVYLNGLYIVETYVIWEKICMMIEHIFTCIPVLWPLICKTIL